MALIGQSAHGKTDIHRYYGHKQLVGEKITCPIKRFPASEIEEAILQHVDKTLSEPGHLDLIENNIEKSVGADRSATKAKKQTLAKAIEKTEVEIDSIFNIVSNMKSGSAGTELIQDKLQKLAEKKKSLDQEMNLLNQMEQTSNLVSGAKKFIETNVRAVKASLKRAKPHLQKKLLGTLFQQLIATDAGIKVFYNLSEDMNLVGKNSQIKKPSESISDGFNNLISQTHGFFMSQSSPIHCVGGGGGNRTRVQRTFQ